MKLGKFSKLLMFFSSYTLLFLALAIKNYTLSVIWLMLLISIVGVVATSLILKTKINPDSHRVEAVQVKNEQVLGYLATYILPFLSFNLEKANDQIALLIIFISIGILYIKADLLYINPILMLLGYNIYEVTFEDGKTRILITKKTQYDIKGKIINFYELEDRVLIIEKIIK